MLPRSSTPCPSRPVAIAHTLTTEPLYSTDYFVKALEKMAVSKIPCDFEDDAALEATPTVSDLAERVNSFEHALTQMIRTTEAHANRLVCLQAAHNYLAGQLVSATERLDELERAVFGIERGQSRASEVLTSSPDPQYQGPAAPLHDSVWSASGSAHLAYQWHDMSDIAATLAAAPKRPASVWSRSSSSGIRSFTERRSSRPHREEHVKRCRISYDRNGGQTPDISPAALSAPAGVVSTQQQLCSNFGGVASCTEAKRGAPSAEAHETSESSLACWLLEKASKAFFGE